MTTVTRGKTLCKFTSGFWEYRFSRQQHYGPILLAREGDCKMEVLHGYRNSEMV